VTHKAGCLLEFQTDHAKHFIIMKWCPNSGRGLEALPLSVYCQCRSSNA